VTATVSRITETGGRGATTRHISPKLAVAVGMPATPAPRGWRWVPLTYVARLESGHTPSRKHLEYWGGNIPWISIQDARGHHAGRIDDTIEHVTHAGIANSSARVLPTNTVCLSRTASVGYVVVMGRPMATSQDFVNWVCSPALDHNFLKYLFIAEGDDLLRFASGAVHQTIYFPEAKAFVICLPPPAEQHRLISILDETFEGIATAKANAEKSLQNARAIFESHANSVFANQGPNWAQITIDQVSTNLDSKRVPITKSDRKPGMFPYYGASGIVDYVSDYIFDGDTLIVSEDGANLVMRSMPIAFSVSGKYWVNNHAHILKFKHLATQRFVEFYLNSIRLDEFITGAAQPKLNQTALNSIPIPIPRSLADQEAIVQRFESLHREIDRLAYTYTRKVTALDELRQSVLHHAFTGQL
jgi:type I restriction enzyme, S subunit